jgi:hypothetical protein
MPRDARLEAAQYFDGTFNRKTKLNFKELFDVSAKKVGQESPWNYGHFTSSDFVNRVKSRERILNPRKGFVDPEDPQKTEGFIGLGRFNPDDPENGYDFDTGRPITRSFKEDPDFNQLWVEKYLLSPVRNPEDDLAKTMPNINNPDPQNFLAMRAQKQAEEDTGAEPTAEQVVKSKEFTAKQNEEAGAKVEEKEQQQA